MTGRTKVSPSGLRDVTYGRRNRFHNGDFRVDQINVGASTHQFPAVILLITVGLESHRLLSLQHSGLLAVLTCHVLLRSV